MGLFTLALELISNTFVIATSFTTEKKLYLKFWFIKHSNITPQSNELQIWVLVEIQILVQIQILSEI